MTKYSNIAGLMDKYVQNVEHINEEQIKIVIEGFDIIKKKFEIDIIEYKWLISVFEEKRKGVEKITEKRMNNKHRDFIKKLTKIIIETEQLIKDAQKGILENDKMKITFERAIEYTDKKEI